MIRREQKQSEINSRTKYKQKRKINFFYSIYSRAIQGALRVHYCPPYILCVDAM